MKKMDFPTISDYQKVHGAIQKLNIEKLGKGLDFDLPRQTVYTQNPFIQC